MDNLQVLDIPLPTDTIVLRSLCYRDSSKVREIAADRDKHTRTISDS